jgi:mannan endo-1,4-beta-mannosidase
MQQANANGKIAALTETGVLNEELTTHPHFFTQDILRTLTTSPSSLRLAYMLTWTNQPRMSNAQYYVYDPYPGHSMAQEYMDFYNDPKSYFLSDLKSHFPQLYH